jgi:3-hydroxy-5-methyl-1-naphthoate 3-O-methyltransferase
MTMSTTEDHGALMPVPLMQISTGFWAFKTLAAANELDLFTRLAGRAETTAGARARARDRAATGGDAADRLRPTTWDPERERSMFEREDPAVLETFWEAMQSVSGFTARTLGDAIDLDAATRLLDVGGGSGRSPSSSAGATRRCARPSSICPT